MENGVTLSIKEITDTHVTVIEHIDLTHPDCPVTCINKALNDMLNYGTYIERDGIRVSPEDFYNEPPITSQE